MEYTNIHEKSGDVVPAAIEKITGSARTYDHDRDASKFYESVREFVDSDDPEVHYALGCFILERFGSADGADHLLKASSAGLVKADDALESFFERGDIPLGTEEMDFDAEDAVISILEKRGNLRAVHYRGTMEERMITRSGIGGDWNLMEDCYARAAEAGLADGMFDYGRILLAKGDYEGARRQFESITDGPCQGPSKVIIGTMYWNGYLEGGREKAGETWAWLSSDIRRIIGECIDDLDGDEPLDWEEVVGEVFACLAFPPFMVIDFGDGDDAESRGVM